MKSNSKPKLISFVFSLIVATGTLITLQNFQSSDNVTRNFNFQDLRLSASEYSNATVISDGYNGYYWNDNNLA